MGTCSIPLKELKGIIGTDQTGRFPVLSRRGHRYIFILTDIDTDFIYAVPIKSRKTEALIQAFEEAHTMLTKSGFTPVLQRMDHETSDHETSEALITAMQSKGLDYELVPPGNHQRNPAERAIQTFKSHFIAILNGMDANYPADAWDHLIPQADMTLNTPVTLHMPTSMGHTTLTLTPWHPLGAGLLSMREQ